MKKRIIQTMLMAVLLSVTGSATSVARQGGGGTKPGSDSVTKKNQPVKRGSGINAYVLGSSRRLFFDVYKVWPSNRAHIGEGEEKCEIFCPKYDLKLGDFLIPADHVYLVFYQEKLMRIRIINPFGGKGSKNLNFFTTIRAGLTQKYGDAKSTTPVFTRYDGTYIWNKGDQKITLTFEKLEYAYVPLEKELLNIIRKKKVVNTTDL